MENVMSAEPVERSDGLIGDILLLDGTLTENEVNSVVVVQRQEGLRFGEAAVRLGLIQDEDINRALARQFQYPYTRNEDSKLDRRLFAAHEPFTRMSEALRSLRSQLSLRWFKEYQKTLAVISPRGREGGSVLAANLAIAFAQLGERTLLIDANLRSPIQHRLFGIGQSSGLTGLLGGRCSFKHSLQAVPPFEHLSVMCAGAPVPNPQELLARDTFTNMMEALPAKYDAIIVDTAPALDCADAQIVAARAGGCLLVTRRHRTRARDLERTAQQIVPSGALILGAVISD